jgi:hypothetical protein
MVLDRHGDTLGDSNWTLLDLARTSAADLERLSASGAEMLVGRNVNGHRRIGHLVEGIALFDQNAPILVLCPPALLERAAELTAHTRSEGILALCEPGGVRWGAWTSGSTPLQATLGPLTGQTSAFAAQVASVDPSKASDVFTGDELYMALVQIGSPREAVRAGPLDIGYAVVLHDAAMAQDAFTVRRMGGMREAVRVGMIADGLNPDEQHIYSTLRRGDMGPEEAILAAQLFRASYEPQSL